MNAPIRRKPTSLSLQEDLVAEAETLGLDIAQIAEQALGKAVHEARAAAWLAENRPAIEAYNRHVEQHGMFIDDIRSL